MKLLRDRTEADPLLEQNMHLIIAGLATVLPLLAQPLCFRLRCRKRTRSCGIKREK